MVYIVDELLTLVTKYNNRMSKWQDKHMKNRIPLSLPSYVGLI